MAAGLGFKTFTTGEVLTAGDVNGYLMQGINVFATTTARNAAITAPAEGQFAFTKDTNSLWYYDGAAWVASGATGDIEGVTAGVGISGGGTSGTVTVTNSMATAIDAKGDLVPGTGADTFSRLAVGANGTVLTADSAEATGLKWAAIAAASAVGVQVVQTSNQTVSTSTNTAVTWNSDPTDTDAMWSSGANTRLTIPSGKGGKWFFNANLTINNAAGQTKLMFYKNGSLISNNQLTFVTSATNITGGSMSAFLTLAAADYLELFINSTGATVTISTETHASLFYVGA